MVVFLDIDGVLATDETYDVWRSLGCPKDKPPLDRVLVSTLDAILVEAKADVILSSSWRLDGIFGYEVTVGHLRDAGLTVPIIGCTTLDVCRYDPRKMSFSCPRGYEIIEAIEDRGLSLDQIVVIDDDYTTAHVPPGKPVFTHRWIKTPEPTGLAARHFTLLRTMLGL